ncbi:MAG: lipid A biosynthesis acyltransferase [Polyangiales bacterium]
MSELAPRRGWLDVAEVGSVWGIRFVVRLCRLFGRGAARAFLRAVVFYYVLFAATGRRASRAYFARLGQGASFRTVYRHFCTFADVALDRLLIASGERSLFEVTSNGREHLEALMRQKRGALLIGAHHGSFEAMRLGAVTQQMPINMVVNFSNAKHIQAVLDQLDPQANARFISVAGGTVDFVLKIRECIERGEMVAILADRVGVDARTVEVEFLGGRARFAAGPFILAAALHCPVLLTFGLYRGGKRYDLYCEPFADAIELPRKSREQALQATVQRFAARLEAYVHKAPYNWFNFYDFWRDT